MRQFVRDAGAESRYEQDHGNGIDQQAVISPVSPKVFSCDASLIVGIAAGGGRSEILTAAFAGWAAGAMAMANQMPGD